MVCLSFRSVFVSRRPRRRPARVSNAVGACAEFARPPRTGRRDGFGTEEKRATDRNEVATVVAFLSIFYRYLFTVGDLIVYWWSTHNRAEGSRRRW